MPLQDFATSEPLTLGVELELQLVSTHDQDLVPQAEDLQSGEAPQSVTVAMDAKGQLFFNDKPVDAAGLAQQFEAAARRNRDTEVQLRVDETVPYGQVVTLMGAAQKAGLSRIGFVAKPASR